MNRGFGELLQELRKEKGWTQQELADNLSVTNKSVSKWERNESYPETATLIEISKIFNITVDDLLNGRRTEVIIEEKNNDLENQWQIKKAGIISKFILLIGLMLFYGIYFTTHDFIPSFFVFAGFAIASFTLVWLKVEKLKTFTNKKGIQNDLVDWFGFFLALLVLIIPCYNWLVETDYFGNDMLSLVNPNYYVDDYGVWYVHVHITLNEYIRVWLSYLILLSFLIYFTFKSILEKKPVKQLKQTVIAILMVVFLVVGFQSTKALLRIATVMEKEDYIKFKDRYYSIASEYIEEPKEPSFSNSEKLDGYLTEAHKARYRGIVGFDDEKNIVYYRMDKELENNFNTAYRVCIAFVNLVLVVCILKTNKKEENLE